MNFPERVRSITNHHSFGKASDFFKVRDLLRKIYWLSACPKNKIKKISFEGIESSFHINDYSGLRNLEGTFTKGYRDERIVLRKLIQILQPGDAVYDIGASVGIHTIFMAKKVGEKGSVIAFEPESRSYETLMKNMNLNNLRNIIPVQIALGVEFNEASLYCDGCFTLIARGEELGQKTRIVPGDFWVTHEELPFPKVVKIDVEGYEYNVIQGLKNTLQQKICKMICCEIHQTMLPQERKSENVVDLLRSYGFIRVEYYPRGETFHALCYKK
jgi:FkbM family methyltransferase